MSEEDRNQVAEATHGLLADVYSTLKPISFKSVSVRALFVPVLPGRLQLPVSPEQSPTVVTLLYFGVFVW